jgi:hypothetical protein
VLTEQQLIGLGEVLDGRDFVQDLPDPLFQQPVEGRALDPDQVREWQHLRDLGEGDTLTTRNDDIRQKESPLRGAIIDIRRLAGDGTASKYLRTPGTQTQPERSSRS